jgi:uncharacterized protein YegP (UPF0339 family)
MIRFTIDPASGGYRAHLRSGGDIIWWTEVYVHKAGAENAIRIAKVSYNAPVADNTLMRKAV